MLRFSVAAVVALVGAAVHHPAAQRALSPVTDAMLRSPHAADWLMWRRTLDSWGYSPLDQIDRSNVGRLALVWSRGLAPGIQEGTPLVHDSVMFMPNPLDVVQAINAATGDLLWEYRRQLPADLGTFIPFPAINRNLAIYDTTIIDTSADDFVYALDAATGTLRWETRILDYRQNAAQQTSGPIIARGMVVSGRGCEPKGGPDACVIAAHDARTGKEVWRTRTIPKPGEPGDDTWGGVAFESRWHVGTWMVPSYDPELDLIYIGTSVTSPAPKFLLGGNAEKHLYHNSTLALRADTGRIAWYYQYVIDHWDLDHPFERLLVDTPVAPDAGAVRWVSPRIRAGERRRVMTGIPGKTGIVYTIDEGPPG
jgi:alcohol dehydrogenase (cytochrome c)